MAAHTKLLAKIEKSKKVDVGLLLQLKIWENKRDLLNANGVLSGPGLYTEEDLTEREEDIQEWLRRENRRMEIAGDEEELKFKNKDNEED